VPNTTDWKYLDMNYQVIAQIDQDKCIKCGKCYVACEDTSHQSIAQLIDGHGVRTYEVIKSECVGCNLCEITCPVRGLHHDGAAGDRQAIHELDAGSAQSAAGNCMKKRGKKMPGG
jgi:NAD-dependent dihydropyrimidine dehydrogenase PreA subunit